MSRLPVLTVEGKRYVLVPEAEYGKLLHMSHDRLPAPPPADSKGYRPALPFIDASIAQDIIRERRAAGLSQQQLAAAAGLRQETLSRIESGKHSPTVRTLRKIESAIRTLAPQPRCRRRAALQPQP